MTKLELTKKHIEQLKALCKLANPKWIVNFDIDPYTNSTGTISITRNKKNNYTLIHWFEFVTGILAQKLFNPNNKLTDDIIIEFRKFLLQTN